MNNLRWRILLIVVIIGACLWAIIPPDKKIRLGLDLKGGVHLVLRVQTDEALRLETETSAERVREDIEKAGITGATFKTLGPTSFQVTGVPPAQDALLRQASAGIQASYNREGGTGGTYTFVMKPNIANDLAAAAVTQAQQTIERRVNELGVAEPMIAKQGAAGDQLLVQLPGVTDIERAKSVIQSTALLELKLVEQGPAGSRENLLQATNGQEPPNTEVLPGVEGRVAAGERPATVYYLVRKVPIITGRDLRSAKEGPDSFNQPAIHFSLKPDGATKFARATSENINRRLGIVLDRTVVSAPNIESRIADEGQITGSFTMQEAEDLALKLRSGALPAPLTYLQQQTIGPTLGADSIRAGVIASLASLTLVALFMLFYYKLSGVNSVVALVFNLIILLGAMAYIGATMTLPGIAGFVLTMGVGVDSNVLIFERIKEELAAQRGVRASINTGFSRVFLTLVDTHLSALISAAFLFQFGTGPIRGFATTLFFGLVSNLFTATFVSKTMFEVVLAERHSDTLSI
ncbi:MAG TPA: protein translocase subunit SecD [Vicinamibacterales bacterium]|jgi:preprotein translocase subunit SecD